MLDPYDLTQKNVIYGLHAGDGVIRYVGQTTQCAKDRFNRHKRSAHRESDVGYNYHVYRWMRKVGVDSICMEILQICNSQNELNVAEMKWISDLRASGNNLTNHTLGGGGQSGWKMSDETRKKISQANKGRVTPEHVKRKLSEAGMGRVFTQETRDRLAIAKRGVASGTAKLDDAKVMNIWARLENGEWPSSIANDYSVPSHLISRILRGERWSYLVSEDYKITVRLIQKESTRKRLSDAKLGELAPVAKLSVNDVREIRLGLGRGESGRSLAARFGVTPSVITNIKQRKTWGWLDA